MSERASAVLALTACSGDMYSGVPNITPVRVNAEPSCGVSASALNRASPRSRTLIRSADGARACGE